MKTETCWRINKAGICCLIRTYLLVRSIVTNKYRLMSDVLIKCECVFVCICVCVCVCVYIYIYIYIYIYYVGLIITVFYIVIFKVLYVLQYVGTYSSSGSGF